MILIDVVTPGVIHVGEYHCPPDGHGNKKSDIVKDQLNVYVGEQQVLKRDQTVEGERKAG